MLFFVLLFFILVFASEEFYLYLVRSSISISIWFGVLSLSLSLSGSEFYLSLYQVRSFISLSIWFGVLSLSLSGSEFYLYLYLVRSSISISIWFGVLSLSYCVELVFICTKKILLSLTYFVTSSACELIFLFLYGKYYKLKHTRLIISSLIFRKYFISVQQCSFFPYVS